MELDANLFDCYYCSGNYDRDIHSGSSGLVMRRISSLMESPFSRHDQFPLTLEVASGAGGHVRYVQHQYDQYIMTDIRRYGTEHMTDSRKPFLFVNAENLPFGNNSIDRLISTCLLHHLGNPLEALSQWRDAVRPGGSITIFLPCDPGMLWRLGRRVGPRRKALRHGVDYDFLMAVSHRNHVGSLVAMLRSVFKDDSVRRSAFPIPLLGSWNLNLAHVYQITKQSRAAINSGETSR